MKIGFSKKDITPQIGLELGGYAGYRPNEGVHDPLYCKTILLEQDEQRYAMIALDLLCVDESLCAGIADAVTHLQITRERLIVFAIHSHAAPVGVIPGEGALARINTAIIPDNPNYSSYMQFVINTAAACCKEAISQLEGFRVRSARGTMPPIGLERHTGEVPKGELTVLQFYTDSGKNVVFYNFPCHPTVLSAANLFVSADFVGQIEKNLHVDMSVFANAAAGDISTRFTRLDSSFEECARMAEIVAQYIVDLIKNQPYIVPCPLRGQRIMQILPARELDTEQLALIKVEETTKQWEEAVSCGANPSTIRILKSYVEGAGVNLEFVRLMGNIQCFTVPVSFFTFAGLNFVTIPGEFYSTLLPKDVSPICYANGYYRYIADMNAYDSGHYEALAAIVGRGSGELLSDTIRITLKNTIKEEEKL